MSGALIVVLFVTILVLAASVYLPKEHRAPVQPDEDHRRDLHGIDRMDAMTPARLEAQIDEK